MTHSSENPSAYMLWFDLDDTLWDMNGNSVVCLHELFENQGLGSWFASAGEWIEIYHRVNGELWRRYGRGEISRDYLRAERFAEPLRLVGVDRHEALSMSARLDTLYLESLGHKTSLMPGARTILEYLARKGYRMGIVSNGFREVQYSKLRSSSIDGFFEIVVLSDDAGVNKPARRFFDYAVEKAGSRALRNVIVGDNYEVDIEGALNAGWEQAIWYDRSAVQSLSPLPPGVKCISSLGELTTLF